MTVNNGLSQLIPPTSPNIMSTRETPDCVGHQRRRDATQARKAVKHLAIDAKAEA
jgi:hypothetical protein